MHEPSTKQADHKSKWEKTSFCNSQYRLKNEVSNILIIPLGLNRTGSIQFKQPFEFSKGYSEIWPVSLTIHTACTYSQTILCMLT